MDKLQLEYFLSVAQTLNISKSAEALYISQSSLSQTIKRLEKEIGYSLFDRNGKHLMLNENGRIFLRCVNEMQKLYNNALEEISERNDMINREINLNMRCASYFLPQLMIYLRNKLPHTAFRISQHNYNDSHGNDIDLMIFATPEPINSKCTALLLQEDILLAVPKNHKLFHASQISISDLAAENFISLNPAWSLEQAIRAECERNNLCPETTIQVDNPDVLRRLLSEQLGLAFVPEKTWGNTFSNGMFELRTISDFALKRYVYIEWADGFLRKNIKECISHIQDFFAYHQ